MNMSRIMIAPQKTPLTRSAMDLLDIIEFSLKTAPPPGDGVVQGESCRSGYIIPLLYRSIYTMPLLWEHWMVHGSCLTGVEQHAMSQCFTPNHIPYMLSCHHGFLNELDISTR